MGKIEFFLIWMAKNGPWHGRTKFIFNLGHFKCPILIVYVEVLIKKSYLQNHLAPSSKVVFMSKTNPQKILGRYLKISLCLRGFEGPKLAIFDIFHPFLIIS